MLFNMICRTFYDCIIIYINTGNSLLNTQKPYIRVRDERLVILTLNLFNVFRLRVVSIRKQQNSGPNLLESKSNVKTWIVFSMRLSGIDLKHTGTQDAIVTRYQ